MPSDNGGERPRNEGASGTAQPAREDGSRKRKLRGGASGVTATPAGGSEGETSAGEGSIEGRRASSISAALGRRQLDLPCQGISMTEEPKKMPLISLGQPTLSENSGAPAQPTLSDNTESSSVLAKLMPFEIILRTNMSRSTASEEEYYSEEEDDDEEDDEQLGKRLNRKFLHCVTCPAPSFHLPPCRCKSGKHVKACALNAGGGNKKCGRCGGPLACTHDIFGPSGDFIDTGSLPCGYCVLPALYTKMKGGGLSTASS